MSVLGNPRWHRRLGIGCVVIGVVLLPWLIRAQLRRPVSRFGEYQGYSPPSYRDWVRHSRYVAARDGTRLAVDVFRPTQEGKPVADPLPAILTVHRYQRGRVEAGKRRDILDREPWLAQLIRHGYVFAVADARGTGASFGTSATPLASVEAQDAYDLVEWLAAQPWCSGDIGMIGRSYMGVNQYLTAGENPPHLRAIFPEMAALDLYKTAHRGGVFRDDFLMQWSRHAHALDRARNGAPVDGDRRGFLRRQALHEHRLNRYPHEVALALPFRDSVDPRTGAQYYVERDPRHWIDRLDASGVAVYHWSGWWDAWVDDALTWFSNTQRPELLTIGPWCHTGGDRQILVMEQLRWFDYWLKGIENQIMERPKLRYAVIGASEWRTTEVWPPTDVSPLKLHLGTGPTGTVASANDGALRLGREAEPAADAYVVDYEASTGPNSRWANIYATPFTVPELSQNDARCLTYTSEPILTAADVVGHPSVELWISSESPDVDVFVYLSAVDPDGRSHYITEGCLKASHRGLAEAPYHLPSGVYHTGFRTDCEPLDSEPARLVVALLPTAYRIPAGHRLRLTVAGADADNAFHAPIDPPAQFTVIRSTSQPSRLHLPIQGSLPDFERKQP